MKEWRLASEDEINNMTFDEAKEIIIKQIALGHTTNDFRPRAHMTKAMEIILSKAIPEEAHWIPSQKCIVCTWDVTSYIEGYECSECGRFEEEKEPYCNCGCKMV